jgi:uncharacterized protein (DUF302 family)
MAYGIKAVVGEPWEVVLGRMREALAEQGFEVLTELDLSKTVGARLGVDLPPQVVLGVSRIPLTYAALQAEPSVGVLLPWHLVVRAQDDSTTVVEAANLQLVIALTGNSHLEPVVADASARLAAAMASLTRATSLT